MASLSDLYTHLKTLCEQWFYTKTQIDTSLSGKASSTHTHGNLSNDGKVGSNSNYFVVTTTNGAITSKQKIGDITINGTYDNIYPSTFAQDSQGDDRILFVDDSNNDTIRACSYLPSYAIQDSNAYSNIGTSANATQQTINNSINTRLGELVDINFVTVVQTLPTASSSTMGKIYLVAISGSGTNNYAEYVTVKDGSTYSWEKFGEVSGSGLSVDWSDITSKPSTFPPSSHTHNNITNDGKVTVTGTSGGNMVVTNSSNEVVVDTTINVMDALVQQLIQYGS